jgi:hypothetical protein
VGKRVHGVVQFQAQGLRGVQLPCNTNQRLGELAVQAPVASLVGVGQIAAREVAAQSQVIRLCRRSRMAAFRNQQIAYACRTVPAAVQLLLTISFAAL